MMAGRDVRWQQPVDTSAGGTGGGSFRDRWSPRAALAVAAALFGLACGISDRVASGESPGKQPVSRTPMDAAAEHAAMVAAHPGEAYSPTGAWPGPIVVPDRPEPDNLPMRMYHDPELPRAVLWEYLDERIMRMSERSLRDGPDLEVREVAALQLARIAREKYADISDAFDTLRQQMESSPSLRVRRACALALAEGNCQDAADSLIEIARISGDPERRVIESALARWKTTAAADLWRARLPGMLETTRSVQLACEGLSAIRDSTAMAALRGMPGDAALTFGKRMAAAQALAQIDGAVAEQTAQPLVKAAVLDRILAVALLDQPAPSALSLLEGLADDPADGVAAAAWLALLRQDPARLQSRLEAGSRHRDSAIRETAARVIRLFPDEPRLTLLQSLMNDGHVDVRNVARMMAERVAVEQPPLAAVVERNAAATLVPDSPDGFGIEQSLYLLGQLRADKYSSQCVPLLTHPRREVTVAASWLIHLFPDPAIRDAIVEHVRFLEARLHDASLSPGDPPQRMAFLVQYLGVLRIPDLEDLYRQQFSKAAPGGVDKRAACLWALALLHERDPDPDLIPQFESRVQDRGGMMPEGVPVRRVSVLCIGLMRGTSAVPTVEEAFEVDSLVTSIPVTAQWVLPLLGEPLPPHRPQDRQLFSGWRLAPTTDSVE
jgi:HEAT repeat protein